MAKAYKVKIELSEEVVAEIAKLGYDPEGYFTVIVDDLLNRYNMTANKEVVDEPENQVKVGVKNAKAKKDTKVEKG
jgi:hypothetical protein